MSRPPDSLCSAAASCPRVWPLLAQTSPPPALLLCIAPAASSPSLLRIQRGFPLSWGDVINRSSSSSKLLAPHQARILLLSTCCLQSLRLLLFSLVSNPWVVLINPVAEVVFKPWGFVHLYSAAVLLSGRSSLYSSSAGKNKIAKISFLMVLCTSLVTRSLSHVSHIECHFRCALEQSTHPCFCHPSLPSISSTFPCEYLSASSRSKLKKWAAATVRSWVIKVSCWGTKSQMYLHSQIMQLAYVSSEA